MKNLPLNCVYLGGVVSSLLACVPIDSVIGSNSTNAAGASQTSIAGPIGQGGTPNTSTPIVQGRGGVPYTSTPIVQGRGGVPYTSTPIVQGQGGVPYTSTPIVQGRGGVPYTSTPIAQGQGGVPYTSTPITQSMGGVPYTSTPSTNPGTAKPDWTPRVPDEVLPLTGTGPLAGAWDGTIWYQAPGYAGPPLDFLTIALDDEHLRSLAFRDFFVDDVVRPTMPGSDPYGRSFTIESETFTASGFEIRYHRSGTNSTVPMGSTTVRGQLRDDGRLAVDYSATRVNGAELFASGSAILNKVDAARPAYATIRGTWYNVVDVTAPGFGGPPRDQMAIAFTDEGVLRDIRFEDLPTVPGSYGDTAGEYPLNGSRLVHMDNGRDYYAQVQHGTFGPAGFDFAIWIQDYERPESTDLVVDVTGTLDQSGLLVDYHCDGKLWGAQMNAHAQGTLLP